MKVGNTAGLLSLETRLVVYFSIRSAAAAPKASFLMDTQLTSVDVVRRDVFVSHWRGQRAFRLQMLRYYDAGVFFTLIVMTDK